MKIEEVHPRQLYFDTRMRRAYLILKTEGWETDILYLGYIGERFHPGQSKMRLIHGRGGLDRVSCFQGDLIRIA